ncbi:WD40 repeat domain-containing protein, partial [Frankia sp. R82]|uniref:WD40 repeat domain-containing protein n=1 Tax=Frankia sp. R82 TaxID=2950553 RepID=UPI002044BA73
GITQHQQEWDISPRSHPVQARKIWASPDRRLLAVLMYVPTPPQSWRLDVVSLTDGRTVRSREIPVIDFLFRGQLAELAWSPDSRTLAFTDDREVGFWSLFDDNQPAMLRQDGMALVTLDWHPRSGIAGLTGGGEVVYWPDPAAGGRGHVLARISDEGGNGALRWSPDGNCVAVAARFSVAVVNVSYDVHVHAPTGQLWPAAPTGWVRRLIDLGYPCAMAWRPDSSCFAIVENQARTPPDTAGVTHSESMISVWGRTGGRVETIDSRYVSALDVSWSPEGDLLVSAYTDGSARIWRYPPEHPDDETYDDRVADDGKGGKPAWARSLGLTHDTSDGSDGRAYFSVLGGMRISSQRPLPAPDPADQARHHILVRAETLILSFPDPTHWLPSSTQACQDYGIALGVAMHTFGFPDLELTACDPTDGRTLGFARLPRARCLALDERLRLVAVGGEDGSVTLLDARTLECHSRVHVDEAVVACTFVAADGSRLLVVASDGHHLYDLRV